MAIPKEQPKRPMNRWILFRKDPKNQTLASELFPELSGTQALSRYWKSLDARQMQHWEDLGCKEKAAHKAMYPDYKYKPKRKEKKAKAVAPCALGSSQQKPWRVNPVIAATPDAFPSAPSPNTPSSSAQQFGSRCTPRAQSSIPSSLPNSYIVTPGTVVDEVMNIVEEESFDDSAWAPPVTDGEQQWHSATSHSPYTPASELSLQRHIPPPSLASDVEQTYSLPLVDGSVAHTYDIPTFDLDVSRPSCSSYTPFSGDSPRTPTHLLNRSMSPDTSLSRTHLAPLGLLAEVYLPYSEGYNASGGEWAPLFPDFDSDFKPAEYDEMLF